MFSPIVSRTSASYFGSCRVQPGALFKFLSIWAWSHWWTCGWNFWQTYQLRHTSVVRGICDLPVMYCLWASCQVCFKGKRWSSISAIHSQQIVKNTQEITKLYTYKILTTNNQGSFLFCFVLFFKGKTQSNTHMFINCSFCFIKKRY